MKLSRILLHILQMCTSYLFWFFFLFFVKFWSFLDFVKQTETGGDEHYPKLLLNGWIDFNETFQNSFTHIADVHLLFCFWVFKFFVKFWSFLDFVKQAETGGRGHYPQLLLNDCIDFSETFQNSFTHITDVHLLFCFGFFFYFLSIFCQFWTLSNKLKLGDENYPQLLLNGWIDFNETFQNSFTYIADVHLLFCFWVFKFFVKCWSFLDFVKQAETGGGISIIRNSS